VRRHVLGDNGFDVRWHSHPLSAGSGYIRYSQRVFSSSYRDCESVVNSDGMAHSSSLGGGTASDAEALIAEGFKGRSPRHGSERFPHGLSVRSSACHTFTVPSALAEASRRPSGLNATAVIPSS
jgi:hypothetical protein